MTRLVLAAILPAALASGAMAWLFLGLGGLAQALVTAAVIPDADLLAKMTLAAMGSALSLAIPVGALLGTGVGIRRLLQEGAMLAVGTLGAGPRRIVIPVSFIVMMGAFGWGGMLHFGEPMARASMRETRIDAAVRVQPSAGRTLVVGPWFVAVDDGVLQFVGQGVSGTARGWALAPARTGVVATLTGVSARALDGTGAGTADELVVPLPLAGTRGKVDVAERTTPDLLDAITINERLGRAAYERWMLWKRTLLPLVLVPLGVGAAGLVLRGRGVGGIVTAQAFAIWAAVRVTDQSIGVLGSPVASGVVLAVGGAFLAAGWAVWPARWAVRGTP